ncbi:GNAT family N-acetyltransferase [Pikeienuella piscinae]|uniref:GNAT family N-acetyltransferase n=1 Tax=Pikeienuella piscinae TaxID=2748098 RepID=A0A7L5C183_9RHOB|nr:GNAT family N-acetyltransferase [Pikeienuella piscinae]QIE56236.1 GNAT family N-acetyltransferase [Pikeienuella piscinae]
MTGTVEIGGPRPGDFGWLIGLHGRWYAERMGFGVDFERRIATIVADVAARLAPPRVTMLVARDPQGPLATLTADADDPDAAGRGHIRIVIAEERAKGRGLGKRLMAMGLESLSVSGSTGAWLDTCKGLDAARAVYLDAGFRLVAEAEGDNWGVHVVEQRYELDF